MSLRRWATLSIWELTGSSLTDPTFYVTLWSSAASLAQSLHTGSKPSPETTLHGPDRRIVMACGSTPNDPNRTWWPFILLIGAIAAVVVAAFFLVIL